MPERGANLQSPTFHYESNQTEPVTSQITDWASDLSDHWHLFWDKMYHCYYIFPGNTRRWSIAGGMFGQHWRPLPNIILALGRLLPVIFFTFSPSTWSCLPWHSTSSGWKTTHICLIWDQTFANLFETPISFLLFNLLTKRIRKFNQIWSNLRLKCYLFMESTVFLTLRIT